MESPDEVGSDEINELLERTTHLEKLIGSFTFTGNNVTGNLETGFIIGEDV